MDETTKLEKNGPPPVPTEEETSAKLLTSPKYIANTRCPLDVDGAKDIANTSTLGDILNRLSVTLWDLKKETVSEGADVTVYKRRWIVLLIFVIFAFVGTFQGSMYSIIANVITRYYNVTNVAVEFTTMSFLISYLVAFLPAGWVLNNLGIRCSMLIGCFLNALGCFLRVFSVPRDRFWLTMTGQSIVGLSHVFGSMIPTRLAAVWFPANEVAFACSIALNGYMVACAVGFLTPPILVRNSDNLDDTAEDLDRVYVALAVSAFVSFLLTVAFFQEKPPRPPGHAQKLQRIREAGQKSTESPREFLNSVKRLFQKRAYLILLVSFSLSIGVFNSFSALLNQVIIPHFPGHEKEVGIVGLLLVVPGIVSSGLLGYILDRTHAFKTITMALYLLALAAWISFSVLLRCGNITWMYISSTTLGFCTGGAWLVGVQFAVEITFPEPEGTVSGVLAAVVQLFVIFYTLLYGFMLESWGDIVANVILTSTIVVGCIILAFIRPRLKRQAAQQTHNMKEMQSFDC